MPQSRLIRNASDEVKAWAGIKLRTDFREPAWAFGILNSKGRLCGAVIWNDYEAKNIEMTCIGRGAFQKDVCRELAHYVFNELGLERCSLTVRADNLPVLEMALKFGWKAEGRKRRYYGDVDAVMMGILRHECRFMED